MKIITCMSKNNGIGYQNQLLYKIKEDMEFFKNKTINNIVIMGRKTFESIGSKPLPDRYNIVLTTNPEYFEQFKDKNYNNLMFVEDVESAILFIMMSYIDIHSVFIIGGSKVYSDFLPYTDEIFITRIDEEKQADTFFNIDLSEWKITEEKRGETENLTFITYSRKNKLKYLESNNNFIVYMGFKQINELLQQTFEVFKYVVWMNESHITAEDFTKLEFIYSNEEQKSKNDQFAMINKIEKMTTADSLRFYRSVKKINQIIIKNSLDGESILNTKNIDSLFKEINEEMVKISQYADDEIKILNDVYNVTNILEKFSNNLDYYHNYTDEFRLEILEIMKEEAKDKFYLDILKELNILNVGSAIVNELNKFFNFFKELSE